MSDPNGTKPPQSGIKAPSKIAKPSTLPLRKTSSIAGSTTSLASSVVNINGKFSLKYLYVFYNFKYFKMMEVYFFLKADLQAKRVTSSSIENLAPNNEKPY